MIKTYRKGADYEREIVKKAKEAGHISFRSAGSHSPIDVIIIDEKKREIFLLQCKNLKYISNAKIERLKAGLAHLNGMFMVKTGVV